VKQKKKLNMKIIEYYIRILMAVALVSVATQASWAQDKMEPSIQLSYFKKSDQGKVARVSVSGLDSNNKRTNAKNAHLSFYLISDTNEVLLKTMVTNSQGKASVDLPGVLPLDEERYFGIVARIEDDSLYEDAEEEIWYKEAALSLELRSEDATKIAVTKLTETDAQGQVWPLEGIDVNFYVQRLFGLMPAAEEFTVSTDEEGVASLEFPNNIAGDFEGSIAVVAQVSDDEDYGNLESITSGKWGLALAPEKNPFPRTLWAPNAPAAMIITLSLIFGGIWFIYGYIAYQLKKINKETI
jgi:hypothetical protein